MESLGEVNFRTLTQRQFFPSPAGWEDEVLYFLMLDRFSDGKEKGGYGDEDGTPVTTGTTPLFQLSDVGNVTRPTWEQQGQGWQGGTLRGLRSKLGYLHRLGVSALWISPIFKQVEFEETYHGYGIQDFLSVDRHFGTTQDLIDLVSAAHGLSIRVILDVILNHSGDVFAYNPDRYWTERNGHHFLDPRWDGRGYAVAGFRDKNGQPSIPFKKQPERIGPDDAIWPRELQDPATFTARGKITSWDYDPEFREGDFESLKDIHHGSGPTDFYQPSETLKNITTAYKYWIAVADLDGFRIDTVKHMDLGATRYFASAIQEFAQSIGKEKFFLVGEVTGGRQRAVETIETTGLHAALGVDDIPDKLEYLVKGYRNPDDYFNLFRNSLLIGKESHTWFRDRVVTMFDDHDQVRKGRIKARFCAHDRGWMVVFNALALNATTLGIPCVYYGSEQFFNGHAIADRDGNDLFLRECMFGGRFGSLESQGRHFFNEQSRVYTEFAKVCALRHQRLPLRRGRQYLREISGDGVHFGLPRLFGNEIRSVVPWSRIFADEEMLCAINTDYDNPRNAWVTVDNGLNAGGSQFRCLYSTDAAQIGTLLPVTERNGKAVSLTVPPAGFVIYGQVV
ncbi:MAG TPA: alpha-amylase family glycosyl hydrolase [Chthoniobacterales bacterium]